MNISKGKLTLATIFIFLFIPLITSAADVATLKVNGKTDILEIQKGNPITITWSSAQPYCYILGSVEGIVTHQYYYLGSSGSISAVADYTSIPLEDWDDEQWMLFTINCGKNEQSAVRNEQMVSLVVIKDKHELEITSPKEGAVFYPGDTVTINWKSDKKQVPEVALSYRQYVPDDEISIFAATIKEDVKNKNMYKWKIPADTVPGEYRVTVEEFGGAGAADDESELFEIRDKKASKKNSTKNSKNDVTAKDHFLSGSMKSKVKVVTYSDIECPFCKGFDATVQQLIEDYGSKVAFVFRHFPLTQIHHSAERAANATECMAKLEGEKSFAPYLHDVFESSPDSLTEEALSELAVEHGASKKSFDMCLDKKKYSKEVKNDIKKGEVIAKSDPQFGTPYSIVYDSTGAETLIRGNQPYATVKEILDGLLSQKTTGSKSETMTTKARGTILLSNAYSTSPVRLIANSRLLSYNGLVYRLDSEVIIPGYTLVGGKVIPGTAVATITADEAGSKHQTNGGSFSIMGFEGMPQHTKVTGITLSSIK